MAHVSETNEGIMDESSRKICTALVRNASLPKIMVQLPPAAIEDSIRCVTHHPWWKVKSFPSGGAGRAKP